MNEDPSATPLSFAFLVVPDFSFMALSSLVEPLRAANRFHGRTAYTLFLVSKDGAAVRSSAGIEVKAHFDLASAPPTDVTVVVASVNMEAFGEPRLYQWLRRRKSGGRRVGAVSGGPVILALAGMLDDRKATVHWEYQRGMQERFPRVQVVDKLFCFDGDVMTAAGGSSGMDMMLDLVARRDGSQMAIDISETFLHGAPRGPQELQRQGIDWRYGVTDRRVIKAISLMEGRLANPLRVAQLSRMLNVSERQLTRLFQRAVACSPSEFCLRMRLERAREMIVRTDTALNLVASLNGFSSSAHFSRTFRNHYGTSPSAARRRSGVPT